MIVGAVLNNAAFTGNGKAALEENMQPQKALEDYQAATCMLKYTHNCSMLLDWIESNREIKEQAKQNFTRNHGTFLVSEPRGLGGKRGTEGTGYPGVENSGSK